MGSGRIKEVSKVFIDGVLKELLDNTLVLSYLIVASDDFRDYIMNLSSSIDDCSYPGILALLLCRKDFKCINHKVIKKIVYTIIFSLSLKTVKITHLEPNHVRKTAEEIISMYNMRLNCIYIRCRGDRLYPGKIIGDALPLDTFDPVIGCFCLYFVNSWKYLDEGELADDVTLSRIKYPRLSDYFTSNNIRDLKTLCPKEDKIRLSICLSYKIGKHLNGVTGINMDNIGRQIYMENPYNVCMGWYFELITRDLVK